MVITGIADERDAGQVIRSESFTPQDVEQFRGRLLPGVPGVHLQEVMDGDIELALVRNLVYQLGEVIHRRLVDAFDDPLLQCQPHQSAGIALGDRGEHALLRFLTAVPLVLCNQISILDNEQPIDRLQFCRLGVHPHNKQGIKVLLFWSGNRSTITIQRGVVHRFEFTSGWATHNQPIRWKGPGRG
jgi:hypothetical protein